jgi:hypothetical protein
VVPFDQVDDGEVPAPMESCGEVHDGRHDPSAFGTMCSGDAADNSGFFKLSEFGFRYPVFLQIKMACLCEDGAAGGLYAMLHTVLWSWCSASIPDDGREGGKEGPDGGRDMA